jgi:4-alpha-glucanotransferase
VLAVLRSLGAPLERSADAGDALLLREREVWQRLVDTVGVVWNDEPATFALRVCRRASDSRAICRVAMENGEAREQAVDLSTLRRRGTTKIDGEAYVELELCLPGPWPPGYHRLRVEVGERVDESVVVVAPRRAFGDDESRSWGVFLPLHALHGERGRGAGHYGDLGSLAEWMADLGGRVLGTLPLLAAAPGKRFDASPYLPDSRLMWNDFYLDLGSVPELESSAEARALLQSRRMRRQLADLRAATAVDYPRQAALQREVLELLARTLLAGDSGRHRSFRNFVRSHPEVQQFARYRTVAEKLERPWSSPPARSRGDDLDPAQYHAYTQWLATEQIEAVAGRAARRRVKLYLDLPLGVHPDGFDVWREPTLFARGVEAGAPPDAFFEDGQSWSFPPIHPLRARKLGHRYFAACLRHQMRVAGMLRVDHVMGLHRLFWIPEGFGAGEGVYVRYPVDELYAVLCLESHRHRCIVVGEDLGTVPRSVRPAMRRHNLRRSFVLQYATGPDEGHSLAGLEVEGVASLNTHDLPTFAAFWRGLDLGQRGAPRREQALRSKLRKAWIRDLRRGGWLKGQDAGAAAALRACVAYLAESSAEVVLIGLEDLWLETRAQNVPGTTTERANWCGRARYPFEVFTKMPRVLRTLRELHRRRDRPR